MPGCCAPDCNNSSVKGYLMKIFPRDEKRRAQWSANVRRKNWSPTRNSYLCEVHFEPKMWEKTTVDGRRKLKCNAVPTIFEFYLKKDEKKNKSNIDEFSQEQCSINHVHDQINQPESELIEKSRINHNTDNTDANDINTNVIEENFDQLSEIQTIMIEEQNLSSTSHNEEKESIEEENQVKVLSQQCNKHLLTKFSKKIIILQKKLKTSRNVIRKLKQEINKNVYVSRLKRIFTNDQIRALLTKSTRPRRWSNDTVIKALKLKFACGERGYKEILRQGIPLPNIRTLQNRL